jgi:electron transfer flavoprotein beta subunit
MEFIVCLKQVVDLQQIRIRRETREPVLDGLPLLFGDMDRNALEEAVKIKEKQGGRVIAVAIGSAKLRDTIKDALAGGADEAYLLIDPLFDNLGPKGKAEVLSKAIQKIGIKYDLILLGEGSTDNYSGQVGPRLAEILSLPGVTYVRQLEVGDGKLKAVRSLEESFEVVETRLPALVTVVSEINQPRIPALTQILKAGRKPLKEWKGADIGLTTAELGERESKVLSNLAPVEERKKVIFGKTVDENVDNLINSLIKEGVLSA